MYLIYLFTFIFTFHRINYISALGPCNPLLVDSSNLVCMSPCACHKHKHHIKSIKNFNADHFEAGEQRW